MLSDNFQLQNDMKHVCSISVVQILASLNRLQCYQMDFIHHTAYTVNHEHRDCYLKLGTHNFNYYYASMKTAKEIYLLQCGTNQNVLFFINFQVIYTSPNKRNKKWRIVAFDTFVYILVATSCRLESILFLIESTAQCWTCSHGYVSDNTMLNNEHRKPDLRQSSKDYTIITIYYWYW